MAAKKKNFTGKTFGVEVEAFGISCANYKESAESDVFEQKDENAEVDGEVFHNPWIEATCDGATTATPDEIIGEDIVFANAIANLGGVTGGTFRIRKIDVTRANAAARLLSITARKYGRFA